MGILISSSSSLVPLLRLLVLMRAISIYALVLLDLLVAVQVSYVMKDCLIMLMFSLLLAVPELVPDPVIDTTSFAGYLPQAPPAGNIVPVSCCSFFIVSLY